MPLAPDGRFQTYFRAFAKACLVGNFFADLWRFLSFINKTQTVIVARLTGIIRLLDEQGSESVYATNNMRTPQH